MTAGFDLVTSAGLPFEVYAENPGAKCIYLITLILEVINPRKLEFMYTVGKRCVVTFLIFQTNNFLSYSLLFILSYSLLFSSC